MTRLSELHVFEGDPSLQRPAPGFVRYDVNVPLYSDGAHKHRFVFVPEGEKIHVTDTWWELPVGAYLVKTFYYPRDERDPSLERHPARHLLLRGPACRPVVSRAVRRLRRGG